MTHGQLANVIGQTLGIDSTKAVHAANAVIDELRKSGEVIVEKRLYDALLRRCGIGQL